MVCPAGERCTCAASGSVGRTQANVRYRSKLTPGAGLDRTVTQALARPMDATTSHFDDFIDASVVLDSDAGGVDNPHCASGCSVHWPKCERGGKMGSFSRTTMQKRPTPPETQQARRDFYERIGRHDL